MRFVIDMSNTGIYYSILPAGQSGQPGHINYGDQTRKWLYGEYKAVRTDSEGFLNNGSKKMVLIPG